MLGLCLSGWLLVLAGCSARAPAPEKLLQDMTGRAQGLESWAQLEPAIERSLRYVRAHPSAGMAGKDAWLPVSWRCLEATLEHLLELLPLLDAQPELLTREFIWRRVQPDVLLTGYYESFLHASLEPHPEYPYPIYAPPPDMQPASPNLTREAIDQQGALQGRALEIAWAKDPVDVFFLHVQGSGRLLLPDGSQKYVLYAGSNGHEYVSLGKKLIERGYSSREEMSMQKIREILSEKPERRDALLALNPKYIFFSLGDEGPYGATGDLLTPMVSCAVDKSYIPMGSVLAVSGELPPGGPAKELKGLLLAQDTGTMQRNHLDLYCGSGPKAANLAGYMKGRAWAWVLVSRRCAAF